MPSPAYRMRSFGLENVAVDDRFWTPRQETNRLVTLPIEYRQCRKTGRLRAWKLNWRPGRGNPPHIFWDSDAAKWLEAVGYSLAARPDRKLERLADKVIDDIAAAQRPDGYLNIYYSVVEPDQRWTNLRDRHELYCAGHLMEAAVAYHQATGKRKLLDVLCRYADHIDATFGRSRGKKRGYPGHEEIELALVKLYHATGEKRYLKLAKYFVDERGRRPHYYDKEARARGDDRKKYWPGTYEYNQSHLPVRRQSAVVGHAVRAFYLYAGMADVAAETHDGELLAACKRLWRDATRHKMYVTGGVGPSGRNEGFTRTYDLPNETAYAETCAAIALVFFAHRMLQIEADAHYADVMERALYNGTISGVSADGTRFFYTNPLAAAPPARAAGGKPEPHRREWFGCACCPPNIARLIASLPQYVYSAAGGVAGHADRARRRAPGRRGRRGQGRPPARAGRLLPGAVRPPGARPRDPPAGQGPAHRALRPQAARRRDGHRGHGPGPLPRRLEGPPLPSRRGGEAQAGEDPGRPLLPLGQPRPRRHDRLAAARLAPAGGAGPSCQRCPARVQCTYVHGPLCGSPGMATRTITIDLAAYDRLRAHKREGESFSQVIKRLFRKPVDVREAIRSAEERSGPRGEPGRETQGRR